MSLDKVVGQHKRRREVDEYHDDLFDCLSTSDPDDFIFKSRMTCIQILNKYNKYVMQRRKISEQVLLVKNV